MRPWFAGYVFLGVALQVYFYLLETKRERRGAPAQLPAPAMLIPNTVRTGIVLGAVRFAQRAPELVAEWPGRIFIVMGLATLVSPLLAPSELDARQAMSFSMFARRSLSLKSSGVIWLFVALGLLLGNVESIAWYVSRVFVFASLLLLVKVNSILETKGRYRWVLGVLAVISTLISMSMVTRLSGGELGWKLGLTTGLGAVVIGLLSNYVGRIEEAVPVEGHSSMPPEVTVGVGRGVYEASPGWERIPSGEPSGGVAGYEASYSGYESHSHDSHGHHDHGMSDFGGGESHEH